MEPEEKARFNRQIEAEQRQLIAIGQGHLELQALPINNPDPVPTRQFRKKKAHGLADPRGLTGAEITALELKEREALARKRNTVTPDMPDNEDNDIILFSTPLKPVEESQGATTITLAHRLSPEQPRRTPFFRLLPEEPSLPPASTVPPG
jgi:hypothetical protein